MSSQWRRAIAISAHTPTAANSRIFLNRIINRFKATATSIIMTVQLIAENRASHWMLTRNADTLAMVATAIQPLYIQRGHQMNAIIGKGASHRSIFSLLIMTMREPRMISISKRERPMCSLNHAKIQAIFARLFKTIQGPTWSINPESVSFLKARIFWNIAKAIKPR